MKIAGIITEYNPFHNGHKYHIEEAKRITGADYVIAVMSGNFVQRGTPAVIDKYSRTKMALNNGVDLVLELPVCYATGSAEYFAMGAISLLDKLSVVDYLCFGSECGDISLIEEAAELLRKAPASFDEKLLALLKEGMTYPAARAKALEEHIRSSQKYVDDKMIALLSEPNNILGIEYVKALLKLKSSITPLTIQRQKAHYHDRELMDQKVAVTSAHPNPLKDNADKMIEPVISSATAIRGKLHTAENLPGISSVKASVPPDVYDFLNRNYGVSYPITEEDFSSILRYKLLSENSTSLMEYMDITSDLADRILNITDMNISISDLTKKIKTKNITHARINRALIHLLLNIKRDDFQEYYQNNYTFYARVLGFRKEASHLLRKIKNEERIPIITKVIKATEQLDSLGTRMLSEDIFATHIYNQAVYNKFHTSIPNEFKHGVCML